MSMERIVRVCAVVVLVIVGVTGGVASQEMAPVGGSIEAGTRPVAVSPARVDGVARVLQRCPGFSWSAVSGATGYELVVYRTDASVLESPSPEIHVALPAGSSWWSPSAEACLDRDVEYAWVVRALGVEDVGWSEATIFRVEGPSPEELAAAVALVAEQLGLEAGEVGAGSLAVGAAVADGESAAAAAASDSPEIEPSLTVTATWNTAIQAELPDTSGPSVGVSGLTHSPSGAGVGGNSAAAAGVGGYFTNSGGGDLLAASNSGSPANRAFRVDNSGNVFAPAFSGDGSAVTGVDANLLDGYHANTIQNSHTHAGQAWSTGASYGLYAEGASYGLYGVGSAYGVYAVSANAHGVVGDGGSGAGDFGVYGTGYSGVYGNAENASGYGVYGNGGAYGVYGNGSTYGVYGNSTSDYGVYGNSDYTGVWGQGTSYGVVGINANTGVYASGSSYGIYSVGPAYVSGFLFKAGGGFKIDHPQNPENKYLVHSFVESPDMMNVYNGNVVLGTDGTAWVELPDYFEALNMEFRYQLTALGAPGPGLYVASEIENNRFQIAGGKPLARVSWQVTGVRNDPWARENRPVPVQDKSSEELGTFLHPESYGQPQERGFDYQFGPASVLRSGASTQDQ